MRCSKSSCIIFYYSRTSQFTFKVQQVRKMPVGVWPNITSHPRAQISTFYLPSLPNQVYTIIITKSRKIFLLKLLYKNAERKWKAWFLIAFKFKLNREVNICTFIDHCITSKMSHCYLHNFLKTISTRGPTSFVNNPNLHPMTKRLAKHNRSKMIYEQGWLSLKMAFDLRCSLCERNVTRSSDIAQNPHGGTP